MNHTTTPHGAQVRCTICGAIWDHGDAPRYCARRGRVRSAAVSEAMRSCIAYLSREPHETGGDDEHLREAITALESMLPKERSDEGAPWRACHRDAVAAGRIEPRHL